MNIFFERKGSVSLFLKNKRGFSFIFEKWNKEKKEKKEKEIINNKRIIIKVKNDNENQKNFKN